jgi:hypothetical protein
MDGVIDADQARADAQAYTRWANGPIRVAQKESPGWLFAASELAMAPSELLKWDISLMNRGLLKPASYDIFYTPVKLASGRDTHYSAGLSVRGAGDQLTLSHGGGGSGFLSSNYMWPVQTIAVAAFTNSDWATPDDVTARVAFVVVKPTAAEARARAVFRDFQAGRIDRNLFTENGNAYLTAGVLADQKAGLAAFGPARAFQLRSEQTRGGLKASVWRILTAKGVLNVVERAYPDGKIEQFTISKDG